ncbi:NnrS family protein [Sphingobium sp. H33]|uniref:NnrS family protein n=2 Tax=Sphingobium nicotianae TaxID=2782607 RepID=A0A9X1IT68_9SPHN|nr:NnrS family protein [Sphingobium nicotianae]
MLMALPPILRAGFRPFFLGGSAWAIIALALWISTLRGLVNLPTGFEPVAWHRHEMLFGYLGAVITGFLLTAVPNWTGRIPISGTRLALLAALWLAARLALLGSAYVGAVTAALLDVGFFAVLTVLIGREILAARNRNVPVVVALAVFTLACALDHGEALGANILGGLGWRLGFGIVLVLIAFIGGRIIPSFTRNWLAGRPGADRLPRQPDRFDLAALAFLVPALLSWVALPESRVAGELLVVAGLLQFVRLTRWSGIRSLGEPLVAILHVSFLWLPAGLVLLGTAAFTDRIVPSAALHLLSAGAMASMTLAVMTRATLGHTGRPLHADRLTIAIFALVTTGALLRFAAPFLPVGYMAAIEVAALIWGGAFLLFLVGYGPKLLGSRPDGRP